ncbi:MAG: cupin domain-containing protein [Alphaproteobacteria bacterium]|nr:cupin domain-containing protein [Alphaproteobacteria bacterium]MBQ9035666.1 cupin domain-containing protein [Alphaproteobacteria bacterium]MBR1600473.1 cupin domain-containing protein [Alphaproteobacteria bacterium]
MKKYMQYLFLSAGVLLSSAAYAANSETVIQTDAHWNKQAIKPINIDHPQITMLRITIPAGEKLAMHKHPILNIGYLTKGELTVRSENGDVLVLHPGDPIVELVDIWHYGESTGSEDAEIVVTYVGEKEDSLSIIKE